MHIGVDEVGRGCIAGDLIVVAFAFRPEIDVEAARLVCADSKSFASRKKREAAYELIKPAGLYHVARRTPQQIDVMNIRGATLDAMTEASRSVHGMTGDVGYCFFDGRDLPSLPAGMSGEAVIKGDTKIPEIGAASIIAKVERDREMEEAAVLYPGYDFEKNAGYGTQAHRDAIKVLGLCPIHRSWAQKFL